MVVAAAEEKAAEIGVAMNIAVVDAGNNLTAFVRQEDAWLGSIEIAKDKAFTARAFDISTVPTPARASGTRRSTSNVSATVASTTRAGPR